MISKSQRNFLVAGVLLVMAILIGVTHGPTTIPVGTVLKRLISPNRSVTSLIIWDIRLPRVLAAAVVGGGLAVAGAVMQALLQNPLADPYIVGASAGAGLGAIVTEEFLPGLMAPGAFIGSLAAVGLSFVISRGRRGQSSMLTLILAGYAIGIILSSVTTFLMLTNRDTLSSIFAWEVGGIHGMMWSHLGLSSVLIGCGLALVWPFAPHMNAFLLGEEEAHHLGVHVRRTQVILLFAASLMTAAAVYLSGLIGFVGLVIPHIVRRLNGPSHRQLIPLSFLVGATFLTLADILAENIPGIGTIPVGLVTAFLGGPYFLYLLVRQNATRSL